MNFEFILDSLMVGIIVCLYLFGNRLLGYIFKQEYKSIYEVVYFDDMNKYWRMYVIRLVYMLFITIILNLFTTNKNHLLLLSIILGSFLQIWPSIVNYQLFSMKLSDFKRRYLLGCVIFLVLNILIQYINIYFLIPILFENKELYIFSNAGIQIITSLISYSVIGYINKYFLKDSNNRNNILLEVFQVEKEVLQKNLEANSDYLKNFEYEIIEHARINQIEPSILYKILLLEYSFRGKYIFCVYEKFLVKYFKNYVIKNNMSIGLAQIKISTAKKILEQSPYIFIEKLLEPIFSIELCAKYLSTLKKQYEDSELSMTLNQYFIEFYMGFNMDDSDYTKGLFIAFLDYKPDFYDEDSFESRVYAEDFTNKGTVNSHE